VNATSGAPALQPYIGLPMNLYRSGKNRGDAGSPAVKVSYGQLAANAIDSQLASLAAAGDDSAFTTMVIRFQPAVFRWGLMFARDPDEAEDIVQEVSRCELAFSHIFPRNANGYR
jgi:hypothetical protein